MRYPASSRSGRVTIVLAVVVASVGLIGAIAVFARRGDQPAADAQVLLHTVAVEEFEAFETVPGDVASSSNVEVRCKVKARGGAGTSIVKICEEGTFVKAGDFLLQFDDSVLRNEMLAQRIVVANDKALLIQAQTDLANAQRTLREFDQGLYQQELELLEREVFVAEEELRRAENALANSIRLASRGIVTPLQLKADKFAVEKAKKDVAAASRKVDVYKRFTRDKMIGEYEAEIKKQEANLEAATFTMKLSEQKLTEIEEQITFCEVLAPSDGQVVYANERWGRESPQVIEEGTVVRENQIVIRLPDIRQMQVDVKINEADVNRIKAGNPVEIELDADPDNVLRGSVKQVAAYPFPMRWHGAPLEYGAVIAIHDPPPTIRPGLRAKVKIIFDSQSDVLQVPLSAVIEHEGLHFCLIRGDDEWATQAIEIGAHNNTHVVVLSGLDAGDQVSLTPFRFIKRSELPDVEAKAEPELGATAAAARAS